MNTSSLLSMAAAAALLFSAGCSGGGGGGSDPTPTLTPTATPTPPAITGLVPASGIVGTVVTVTGADFGAAQGASTVQFGDVLASPSSWSASSITVPVPAAALPGTRNVTVTVQGSPSNAQPFAVVLPAAVYTNDDIGQVSGYALSSTGGLAVLAGSPWSTSDTGPTFGGDATSIAVHAGTRRLYASGATAVAAFDINPVTGVLTAVAGSPFATGGAGSNFGVTVSANGNRVFVAGFNNPGTVAAFAVGSSGTLSPVAGSPFAGTTNGNPDGVALSANGRFLYLNQESTQTVDLFGVSSNGSLSFVGASPAHAATSIFALEVHPSLNLMYGAGDGALVGYSLNPTTGAMTALMGSPFAATEAGSPAISADGARLYVGSIGTLGIHVFTIAGDGSLTAIAGSPFATGAGRNTIALSRDGKFLAAVDQQNNMLRVFSLDATGAPTLVGTPVAGPTGATASGIVVVQ